MMQTRYSWLALAPIIAIACGGSIKQSSVAADGGSSSGGNEGGTTGDDGGDDGAPPAGNNVTPLVVNSGPPAAGGESNDVAFVSVTLCVPGTLTCQTIDYVSVDTGSSGFRVLASALDSSFTLPQATASTGNPLVECMTYLDGFVWGSVRQADLKIGGEVAAKIPIQIMGDPMYAGNIPTACSSSGMEEDTLSLFGSNGIIGINQIVPDCGDACADATDPAAGAYYSCAGTTCTPVAVPVADQVPNPIASFASDSNGAILEFPSVPAAGAKTLTGSLIFGIGTQANNALGSATVQTLDEYGNFTTVFNGQTLSESYIDSGTSTLSFNDSSIAVCTGQLGQDGFYCPASPLSLTAQNKGVNGVTTNIAFSVESAETLFGGNNTALDDLASNGMNGSFAWGFPFFIGRNVFIGLDGKSAGSNKGPFVAY